MISIQQNPTMKPKGRASTAWCRGPRLASKLPQLRVDFIRACLHARETDVHLQCISIRKQKLASNNYSATLVGVQPHKSNSSSWGRPQRNSSTLLRWKTLVLQLMTSMSPLVKPSKAKLNHFSLISAAICFQ